jgi:hypothetical protein
LVASAVDKVGQDKRGYAKFSQECTTVMIIILIRTVREGFIVAAETGPFPMPDRNRRSYCRLARAISGERSAAMHLGHRIDEA